MERREEQVDATEHVGTTLLFENEQVRVWELALAPGERAPFHIHRRPYFWTCVEAGAGVQRTDGGSPIAHEYRVGDTEFSEHSPSRPKVHDLENVGPSRLRFVTVELLG